MTHRQIWLALSLMAAQTSPAWTQVPVAPVAGRAVAEAAEEDTAHIEATDLICVVNGEHVLAADVFAYIEPLIEENRKSIPAGKEDVVRRQLLRRMLVQYVQIKSMYQDFLREMIGNAPPSEAKDKRKQVQTKASKLFYEKQVPKMMADQKLTDVLALEEKLRSKGLSLGQLQQQFIEKVLAGEAERKNVPDEVEVLREELIEYYNAHSEQWNKPGKARWRQLTARFDRYPSKTEARAAIEAMGNEVYLGGKPFEAVAKARSNGYTAKDGGVHDWTTQGALKSQPLDQAIFTIEPRRLSQVIEDDLGYHIIEVLERESQRTVSFDDAHDEMRSAIVQSKRQKLIDEYRKKVMDRTVIWTRWPQDIPGSRSLRDVLAE